MHDTEISKGTSHPDEKSDTNRTYMLFALSFVMLPLLGMFLSSLLLFPSCKIALTECRLELLNNDSLWEGVRSSTLGITSLTGMLFVAIILTEGNNLKELRPQQMVLLEDFLYAMCALGGMMSGPMFLGHRGHDLQATFNRMGPNQS